MCVFSCFNCFNTMKHEELIINIVDKEWLVDDEGVILPSISLRLYGIIIIHELGIAFSSNH